MNLNRLSALFFTNERMPLYSARQPGRKIREENMDRSTPDLVSVQKIVTSPQHNSVGTVLGKQNHEVSSYFESGAGSSRGRGVTPNDNFYQSLQKSHDNENYGEYAKLDTTGVSGYAGCEGRTDVGIPKSKCSAALSKNRPCIDCSDNFQNHALDSAKNMGANQSSSSRYNGRVALYKQKSVPGQEESTHVRMPLRACVSLTGEPTKQPLGDRSHSPVIVARDDIDMEGAYSYALGNKIQGVRLGDYTQPIDTARFIWGKASDSEQSPTSDDEYSEPYTFTSPPPDLQKSCELPADSIYSLATDTGKTEYNHLNDHHESGSRSATACHEDDYDHAVTLRKTDDGVFAENVTHQPRPDVCQEPRDSWNHGNVPQVGAGDSESSNSEIQIRHYSESAVVNLRKHSPIRNSSLSSSSEVATNPNSEELYGCAWKLSSGVRAMSLSKGQGQVAKGSRSTDCYEDAWDTVQKQRELQEKVLNAARKTSGAVAPSHTKLGLSPTLASAFSPVTPTTPTAAAMLYEEPWDSKQRQRELEQRLVVPGHPRKVSEDRERRTSPTTQVFRQQNGLPFPSMSGSPGLPRSTAGSGSGSSPPCQYEDAWDIPGKGSLLSYIRNNSQSEDVPVSPTRRTAPKPCTVGENINPIIPLHNQSWYHGRISRSGTEGLLRVYKEGSYLVRESESERGQYSLSIKSAMMFIHLRIACLPNGQFVLGENSPYFPTIPEMIDYYTRHPVPLKGAEHMTLLHPVAKH